MLRFVLASKSPRRQFFLQKRGYVFHTFPVEISEFLDKNLRVELAVEDLAKRKAEALVQSPEGLKMGPAVVLSADTIVVYKDEILGKPKDQKDAFFTLQKLSGHKHRVVTGYCLWNTQKGQVIKGHEVSEVEFRKLSEEEIWDYVRSGDPMDKAGSYGIQSLARRLIRREHQELDQAAGEELGSTFRFEGEDFVKNFTGTLENIAGLPIDQIEKKIQELGWILPKKG
ncbi:Maf family protein [bacterium]|nr:Maf family protein [bacterium]